MVRMFSPFTPIDPASIIASRFSFSQLLLLLSYVLLDSSLPARIGDTRQLRDIISRDRTQWDPRIGEEGFHEIKEIPWEATSPTTRQDWENVREYLLQERLVHSGVSSQEIRAHLRNLLCRVEQISSRSLNALFTPRPAIATPRTQLGVRASLVLVCLSVSVTSTPHESALGTLLACLDEQGIRQIASEIQESPLFRFQIGPRQLLDTLWSLESLFSGEDDKNPARGPGFSTPVQFQHETWTWKYYSTQPTRWAPSSPHDTAGTKRRRQTISTSNGLCTQSLLKRQRRLSSDESVHHSSTTLQWPCN